MKEKILSSGAEAIIYLDNKKIIKKRISKGYRHPELDKQIIKRRTKAETKLLEKASKISNTPAPLKTNKKDEIIIPLIDGKKLSDFLDTFSSKKQKTIMNELGKEIAKIHEEGIIHGDLTTSNIIYSNKKIFIIDFGLGSFNGKHEQKGVDIHLLKQALEAKHFKNHQKLFDEFKIGYFSINEKEAKKVFEKLISIEKRGRYKH